MLTSSDTKTPISGTEAASGNDSEDNIICPVLGKIVEERVKERLTALGLNAEKFYDNFIDTRHWCPETWEILDDDSLKFLGLKEADIRKWRKRNPRLRKPEENDTVHITIMGDTNVGKSCIVKRFIYGTFHTDLPPTLESISPFPSVNTAGKLQPPYSCVGETFRGTIVDTAGQGDFQLDMEKWMLGIGVHVYLFDCTREDSLVRLGELRELEISITEKSKGKRANPCIIVANKIDLWKDIHEEKRKTIQGRLEKMLDSEAFEHCLFFESSAKEFKKPVLEKLLFRTCCLLQRKIDVLEQPEEWAVSDDQIGCECCTIQ